LDQVIESFVRLLRQSGVRVSVVETIDALHAVDLSGYGDRQLLKDFLSAVLAKSLPEKEIFEICFDHFFAVEEFSDPVSSEKRLMPDPSDFSGSLLAQMLLSGNAGGLAIALRGAEEKSGIKGAQLATQKGFFVYRMMQEMGVDDLDADIRRISNEGTDKALETVKILESARNNLYERIRVFAQKRIELYARERMEQMLERQIRDASLSRLEARDLARLLDIVYRMIKRLKDHQSRRRRDGRKGQLDFRKTLKRNIIYQGIPFDTHWKRKKIDKPEIVAICDISRSVSNVVRFLLLFLYGLNESISRIRTFVFCSNLTEVSAMFETYPVEQALERIQSGSDLPILLSRTDYGRSFRDLREGYSDCITRRTTVLILGDARNNYGDPETETLKFISDRCKRIIWLNPEARSLWGSGDSEMKRYLPYCHMARECGTLNHLEKAVGLLLRDCRR
jgi:uncharacterized protein